MVLKMSVRPFPKYRKKAGEALVGLSFYDAFFSPAQLPGYASKNWPSIVGPACIKSGLRNGRRTV